MTSRLRPPSIARSSASRSSGAVWRSRSPRTATRWRSSSSASSVRAKSSGMDVAETGRPYHSRRRPHDAPTNEAVAMGYSPRRPRFPRRRPMAETTARELKLIQYLNEAYGKEKQLETVLQAQTKIIQKTAIKKRLQEHLRETKAQSKGLERRIKQLGGKAEANELPGPDVVS